MFFTKGTSFTCSPIPAAVSIGSSCAGLYHSQTSHFPAQIKLKHQAFTGGMQVWSPEEKAPVVWNWVETGVSTHSVYIPPLLFGSP